MGRKHLLTKAISIILIASGLYQIFLSLNAIFFIYPRLHPGQETAPLIIQEGLVEKALLLYAMMIVDGIYGVALLFKPTEQVKMAHLAVGILIISISVFFITKTPFTSDPLIEFLLGLLKR